MIWQEKFILEKENSLNAGKENVLDFVFFVFYDFYFSLLSPSFHNSSITSKSNPASA